MTGRGYRDGVSRPAEPSMPTDVPQPPPPPPGDPRTLPDFDAAVARLLEAAPPAGPVERVALPLAGGRTLREPILADRDQPPFDRAAMDGYAVRAHEAVAGARLPVSADAPAGSPEVPAGPPGTCVRIATGAPVPRGLDAVVPHERTDRGDPVRLLGPAPKPGDAVHLRGSDARAGDELVAAGTRLTAVHLALAAAAGVVELAVARRPIVRILTTGTEVRGPGESVAPHHIRNSNAPMLAMLLGDMGARVDGHAHAADTPEATREHLAEACAAAELVVTVGGISAGRLDHVADAVAALGGRFVLRGAAIQPGKPIAAARVGEALVLCLPGNPVSCLACGCLFAWPVIARMLGGRPPAFSRLPLLAPAPLHPAREAFRPAVLAADGLRIPAWAGSGDLAHATAAAGLARLPRGEEPLPAGTPVPFLRWPGS
jgi:molybdopterin molybdotransferase